MKRQARLVFAVLSALGVLAACGTTGRQESRREVFELAYEALKQKVTGDRGTEHPSIDEIRARVPELLETVPLPMILVSRRKFNVAEVFLLHSSVANYRTFGSGNDVTITLEGGVLAETRRFGSDLMSSQNGSLPVLLAERRTGDYQRVMRTLDAEGHEISVMFDCRISQTDIDQMTENCTTPGKAFKNIYEYVPSTATLLRSEQWHSETNGYLTIEYLRH